MDPRTLERIHQDFPSLQQNRTRRPPIYLDTACMALKPQQVIDAEMAYYREFPGCHGRTFHEFGRRTTEAVDQARKEVRRFIGAKEDAEVIFLRNVTEGINLLAAKLPLGAGDTVITTGMEHNSNLLPWQRESRRRGFAHVIVPLTPEGELDQDLFSRALDSSDVKLVCTFHRSNLTGVTLPVEWIVDQAHRRGALVAFDGAQAAPHLPLELRTLGADFYVFSFYKMMGPTGIAALYGRRDLLQRLDPPLVGGEGILDSTYLTYTPADLPDRLEPGLQNYAGIIGAAAAVRYLQGIGWDRLQGHLLELNRNLTSALAETAGVRLIGPAAPEKRSSIVNFLLDGLDSLELAHILDRAERIMVRAGKHCAHSWYHAHKVPDSLRISFYVYNSPEEVDVVARSIRNIAREFR